MTPAWPLLRCCAEYQYHISIHPGKPCLRVPCLAGWRWWCRIQQLQKLAAPLTSKAGRKAAVQALRRSSSSLDLGGLAGPAALVLSLPPAQRRTGRGATPSAHAWQERQGLPLAPCTCQAARPVILPLIVVTQKQNSLYVAWVAGLWPGDPCHPRRQPAPRRRARAQHGGGGQRPGRLHGQGVCGEAVPATHHACNCVR